MEAGELARAAGQDKDHDTAFEGPQGPLTGTHGGAGVGAGAVPAAGYDKKLNFNADSNMYDVKSEDVSGSVSMSIGYRTSPTNSPTLSLPEPLSVDALPTSLDTSGVVHKEENQMTVEADEKEVACKSPSSKSGLVASVETQSKATESDEEAVEAADADVDAAGAQYPADASELTAVSAAEEVEAEVDQSDLGQNKVNERAKRKFDDLDVVHSNDVSGRRDVTMEKESVSELDVDVGTEFSTLHTAERSVNLFREI
jgi:hypothetical protein